MRFKNKSNFALFVFSLSVPIFIYTYIFYYEPVESKNYNEIILEMTRLKIKFEMWYYNFSYSDANKLEDLVMEAGGNPVRSIIVTTWRTGSSFLGDLLNAMPSNFYHYEPLALYESQRIKRKSTVNKVIHSLKNMLRCNFSNMSDYFEFVAYIRGINYIRFNSRFWESCKYQYYLCIDPTFSANFCKLFPFQSMKVVRLELRHFESILEDKELNVKLVLLVRDPRAVMRSRQTLYFCSLHPDCADPASLCTDMVDDYLAASDLLYKYPDRLMVLRFEDFVLNITKETNRLLQFLRLQRNILIDEFLRTHTTAEDSRAFSTFRMSEDEAFSWTNSTTFKNVKKIQKVCMDAMAVWGYEVADNESHMRSAEFYPLKPYSINIINSN